MQAYLKPTEIAKRGLIKNSKNSDNWVVNYQFILREIAAGNLKARTYGRTRKYFLVSENELKRYLNE